MSAKLINKEHIFLKFLRELEENCFAIDLTGIIGL